MDKTMRRNGLLVTALLAAALAVAMAVAPSSAFAAQNASGGSLSSGKVSALNNGVLNDMANDDSNYGRIYLYNPNVISPSDMREQYQDERDAAIQALQDAGTWTPEKEEALDKECQDKCAAYESSVSRMIYSTYNFDSYVVYMNKVRAAYGESPLTADEIQSLRESYASTISLNQPQAIAGVSYNPANNTLTLKNVKTTEILEVEAAGNDFKIKLSGTNELGGIRVSDKQQYYYDAAQGAKPVDKNATWGAGLKITGTGNLYVNKKKSNNVGIMVDTTNTNARLIVDKNVSLRVLSNGEYSAIEVSGTNAASWKNAITFKGLDASAQAKRGTKNVSYPLFKPAHVYDAEYAADGIYAFNPNDGDRNGAVVCADGQHVACVVSSHKDVNTGKHVIDQWKVYNVTSVNNYSDGSYDYNYDYNKFVRVADAGGQPAGYPLIQVGTQPATQSYEVADTDVFQYGKTIVLGKTTYTGKKGAQVYLKKAQNKKTVTVGKTVKVNGKKLAVTGIAAKAFKSAKKCKTIKIQTTKLTKKSVKNSLKSAKNVKTVKVPKKQKSKYSDFFTKGNCGKSVTVK